MKLLDQDQAGCFSHLLFSSHSHSVLALLRSLSHRADTCKLPCSSCFQLAFSLSMRCLMGDWRIRKRGSQGISILLSKFLCSEQCLHKVICLFHDFNPSLVDELPQGSPHYGSNQVDPNPRLCNTLHLSDFLALGK